MSHLIIQNARLFLKRTKPLNILFNKTMSKASKCQKKKKPECYYNYCSSGCSPVPLIAGIRPTKRGPPYDFEKIPVIAYGPIPPTWFGPKHVSILSNFIPTAVGYGAFLVITLIYFTDWKVIVTKIPLYGGQFKKVKN